MRVAVIGTGVAGLGAAWALARRGHAVELFERAAYAGGHVNTVLHRIDGRELALGTGFIVHNERNHPRLVELFRELGVRTQASDMSFSVSCGGCRLEYSARRPPAGRLVLEIGRFLARAQTTLDRGEAEGRTLAAWVAEQRYSRRFRDHFLVPLTAAIWSTAPERALDFPATYALQFLDNHGMLGFGRFRWRTVAGGAQSYVRALLDRLGPRLHLGAEVRALSRTADGVELRLASGEAHRFDGAVVATHAPQALALLADPSDDERRLLGAFRTTANEAVLHWDDRLLPRRHAARAAWNYLLGECAGEGRPSLTYYLNRLQALDEERAYCVTLNAGAAVDETKILRRIAYDHPLYTFESIAAQPELPRLNGARRTAFAGAWQGYGFHEDGLVSGLRAESLA